MKRTLECKITKVDDIVVIDDGDNFYKVMYKGSIFDASNAALLKLMSETSVTAMVTFDGCYIERADFGDSMVAVSEQFEYTRLGVSFKNYDFVFRKIDNKDRLLADEKIMLRLTNIIMERDIKTFSYEVHMMSLMVKLLEAYRDDNSLISAAQKKCLKTKKVPVEISSGEGVIVSPYMFFKACGMAMRYTTSPLEEFVRNMPCLPYVDFDSTVKRSKVSINEMRNNIYTAALYMERFL